MLSRPYFRTRTHSTSCWECWELRVVHGVALQELLSTEENHLIQDHAHPWGQPSGWSWTPCFKIGHSSFRALGGIVLQYIPHPLSNSPAFTPPRRLIMRTFTNKLPACKSPLRVPFLVNNIYDNWFQVWYEEADPTMRFRSRATCQLTGTEASISGGRWDNDHLGL